MSWRDLTGLVMKAGEATFGEPVLYTPETGPAFTVRGIFERSTQKVDVEGNADVSLFGPRIDLRTKDLSIEPTSGDQITRDGIIYTVVDVTFDGWAMVRLHLEKP